jgi:predicted Zn finger-like uncharacterized protein
LKLVLTQCPGCQTVFRITGAILRAAHGQVRCGRCNTQFDAIEYLQEEEQADQPAANDVAATTAAEQMPTEFVSAAFDQNAVQHEEITLEGNRIEISGIYRSQESVSEDPVAEHTHTIIEEFNIDSEEWPSPFAEPAEEMTAEEVASAAALSRALASLDSDEDDTPTQAEIVPFVVPPTARSTAGIEVEEFEVPRANEDEANEDEVDENDEVEPQFDPEADDAATKSNTRDARSQQARTPWNAKSGPADETTAEYQLALTIAEPTVVRASTARTSESFAALVDLMPGSRRWPWILVSGALALLFVGQVLHHYRQTLVRHPTFGPPLEQAYELLGQTLEPRWELGAYSIKQWGIVSDPQVPGTLRVRASITNNADFAQPYPLLKLTLEDRFGANLGTREFKPEEYLSSTTSATRRLSPTAAANVDLAIVDPGEEAIGFQFNVCVQHGNGVECTG